MRQQQTAAATQPNYDLVVRVWGEPDLAFEAK
jgi:hypothetical protein